MQGLLLPKAGCVGPHLSGVDESLEAGAEGFGEAAETAFLRGWMLVSLSEERSHQRWHETVQWARDCGLPASVIHLEEEERCLRALDGNDY